MEKFKITEEITLNIEQCKECVKKLNPDEIFDAIEENVNKHMILKSEVWSRMQLDYANEIGETLHKFFNSKSDANKYLMAEQQEDLETEFMIWCENN